MPLPTIRPDNVPDWGSAAAGADIVEPPDAVQAAAWAAKDRPGYKTVNWAWNDLMKWIAHFSASSSRFLLSEDAIDAPATSPLVAGDTYMLHESDLATLPGAAQGSIGPLSTIDAAATDGKFMIIKKGVVIEAYPRDGGALAVTYTPPAASGFVAVATNGVHVVAANGNKIEVWEIDGTHLWTFDHGAVVNDVAIQGDLVFFVGVVTAGIAARARSIVGDSTTWSYDHDADLLAIAVAGRYCFLAGAVSADASSATLRGIVAADGKDLANEGGNGTAEFTWDATPTANTKRFTLAADGHAVYLRQGAGGTTLEARGAADGLVANLRTIPEAIVSLDVDQQYVIVTGATAIRAYRKTDFAFAWGYDIPGADQPAAQAVTDGARVFLAHVQGGTRIVRGNRPGMWTRLAAGDVGAPYSLLSLPSEGP